MHTILTPSIMTFIMFYIATAITIKDAITSRVLLIFLLGFALWKFAGLKNRDRVTPIFVTTSLYVGFCAFSTIYAYSGKFAINEFSKILLGFCIFLLIISTEKISSKTIIWWFVSLASVLAFLTLEGATIGLVSQSLQSNFYGGLVQNHAVFDSDRFTSFFGNANVLATILGMALFLSTYLFKKAGEFKIILAIMMINLGYVFLMAFSMGGTFSLVISVLCFLIFSKNRFEDFLIIFSVFIFSFIIVGLTINSYVPHAPSGKVLPLILVLVFGFLFEFLDERIFSSWKFKVTNRQMTIWFLSIIVLGSTFVLLAFNLTTSAKIQANDLLDRVVYLDEGYYNFDASSDNLDELYIEIFTRDEKGIYEDEDVLLISGFAMELSDFYVSSDVLQVKVRFTNKNTDEIKVSSAVFISSTGEKTSVKLNYLLLPSNIEFRIQGLQTNYSATTRIQYLRDSIKLFAKNPILGYGLGGFENAIQSVQSYHYETKYAHNHFFQSLVDTGIIGFAFYLLIIILCFVKLFLNRDNPRAQVYFGAMCMFLIHTSIELSMSAVEFMPFAFALFAIISIDFSSSFNINLRFIKSVVIIPMLIFAILFSGNIFANIKRTYGKVTTSDMQVLSKIDIYEKNDFLLSYVMSMQGSKNQEVIDTVSEYLDILENANSNSISLILARYFIDEKEPERAYENLLNYINYAKYDDKNWELALATFTSSINSNFDHYQDNTEIYSEQLQYLLDYIDTLNRNSITEIKISDATMSKVLNLIRG